LKTITASWIVLLWPFYITFWGIATGRIMALLSSAPDSFMFASMAACAFGNSTGLPLTLVSIIHSAAQAGSPLGTTDPAIYVSIYLIFNPILQWSVGSWLLEPPTKTEHRRLAKAKKMGKHEFSSVTSTTESPIVMHLVSNQVDPEVVLHDSATETDDVPREHEGNNVREIMNLVFKQLAQPAIVASLCGLFIACIPVLHSLLVDTKDQDGDAPLAWFFEALYTVGKAAIPVRTSWFTDTASTQELSPLTPFLLLFFF
jgi:hypothetical protein